MSKINLNLVTECTRCELRSSCNQVVPGIGADKPLLMFVGEYPEAGEDIEGEPFVDRSGFFFRDLLKKASIPERIAYFTYIVKCKPAMSSKIPAASIDTCKAWLLAEIDAKCPKIVILLGKTPTLALLKVKKSTPMKQLVGTTHCVEYIKAKLMPWYSISYLLGRGAKSDKETITWLREKVYEKLVSELA